MMREEELHDEINKRLTLNWLIQGAAQHAGMTVQHLVRDELDAVNPRLLRLYDQYALGSLLQFWGLDALILFGWAPGFWKRAASSPRHPFHRHPLLAKHGGSLATASRERALLRAKEKGVARNPVLLSLQVPAIRAEMKLREAAHRPELIHIAKLATQRVWGLPTIRMDADLTTDVTFGTLRRPNTIRGMILRAAAGAYGGVMQRGDHIVVVGRSRNWIMLTHELVKGTAELICMHGLSDLDEEMYTAVVKAADRIEYEPWMLQSGGELWRLLLALVDDAQSMSTLLMQMARLPARSLEALMVAVLEKPAWAKELLASLTN